MMNNTVTITCNTRLVKATALTLDDVILLPSAFSGGISRLMVVRELQRVNDDVLINGASLMVGQRHMLDVVS